MQKTLKLTDSKNMTIRMSTDMVVMTKQRAKDLGMSQSYMAALLFALDDKYDILGTLPDILDVTYVDEDEAQEMIKKLQGSGYLVGVPDQKPTEAPPAPEQKKEPRRRPVMHSLNDLIRMSQNARPGQNVFGGPDGTLKMQIREAQIKAAQEDREEAKLRKQILEGDSDG